MKRWASDGHNMFWFREQAKGEKKPWVELVFTAAETEYVVTPGGNLDKVQGLETYRFICDAETAVKALRKRADSIEQEMNDPDSIDEGAV